MRDSDLDCDCERRPSGGLLDATNWHDARKSRARMSRGFTLVELMVVVAMVSIMAAIGIVMLREYVFTARSVEAAAMVQSIRAAEEDWKAQHGEYLDVSNNLANYRPSGTLGKIKRPFFGNADDIDTRWRLLNPTVSTAVQFQYSVVAGPAGSPAVPAPHTVSQPTWPTPTVDPWFVIEAKADKNEDGIFAYFVTSSFGPDVYTENPDE